MGIPGFISVVSTLLATPIQTVHVVAHALILGVLATVIYWVRQSSRERAARWVVILLAVELAWVSLLIVQLLSPVWLKRHIVGLSRGFSALVPVIWLVFILHYTGREDWLTKTRRGLLGALAGSLFLLLATNNWHHLVVREFAVAHDPFTHLLGQPTVLQWMIFGLLYPIVIAGLLLLVDFILSTRHLSRTQTVTIVVAGTVAMATNLLMPLRLGPAAGFDYSGIGTGIFGAAIGWALFNERLFEVAPVARDSIFESFSDPLIAVDLDHAIVDFNGAATDLFPAIETAAGEPLPVTAPDLFTDADEFAAQFEATVDGQTRSFRVERSPIAAGNRQVGVVLQLREVTELEAYARELERRTEQLEVKTEQLEGFASSVSHDLRNPINVAKGRIDLARETGDDEHLETADQALDRGLETIDELLDLARSGQTIGDPDEVHLETLVDNAWNAVDTQAATLDTDLDDERVAVDPGRVQGLFENLFRNALEHGNTDGSIRVAATPDGFLVADDGPGIPADEREKVFDHGYTGGDGTGLGLAKVESIAIAHDWSVSVEESDKGGARFRFQNVSFL